VSKYIYRAQLSSRTSNALNALVSSEQIRFKQTSKTVCTDGRVTDKIVSRKDGQTTAVICINNKEPHRK